MSFPFILNQPSGRYYPTPKTEEETKDQKFTPGNGNSAFQPRWARFHREALLSTP